MSNSKKLNTNLSLEQYIGKVKDLSVELENNFSTMCTLDSKKKGLINDIDTLTNNFSAGVGEMSKQERKQAICKINDKFGKADKYSGDKMQLAQAIYESVDKMIIKMDSDYPKFEAYFQSKYGYVPTKDGSGLYYQTGGSTPGRKGSLGSSGKEDDFKTGSMRKGKKGSYTRGGKKTGMKFATEDFRAPTAFGCGVASTSSALPPVDMPIDPNEPTYCLCNQVSYGEMVACDNPDCVIEWFHFGCVNLTTKPKGNWYCPQCRLQRKNKKKK